MVFNSGVNTRSLDLGKPIPTNDQHMKIFDGRN